MQLQDYDARQRFITEIDENFSVIAPAGVGKTTAITNRIANFIINDVQTNDKEHSLTKTLVAVTYTEKAACEIKERTIIAIDDKCKDNELLQRACHERINNAFFGTIHSFALNFIRTYGHLIGVLSEIEVLQNDDDVWMSFLEELDDPLTCVPQYLHDDFKRFVDVDKFINDARSCISYKQSNNVFRYAPNVAFDKILKFSPKPTMTAVIKYQSSIIEWLDFCKHGMPYVIPDYKSSCTTQSFLDVCDDVFSELNKWKSSVVENFITEIACRYRKHRIKHGNLRYDDLITCAVELLSNATVIQEVEKLPYRVLLDEAQDTDEQQFRLLLGVSQNILHEGICVDIEKNFPKSGCFSMVGDIQQAIYCERADVRFYQFLHEQLLKNCCVKDLVFCVTMRCPIAVVNFVNQRFKTIFRDINFVPLLARPDAIEGSVEVEKISRKPDMEDAAKIVCDHILNMFLRKTCDDFYVTKWSDIAILAPRKDWLNELYDDCVKNHLPVQIHDGNVRENTVSPLQWLASCVRYINNPMDRFEFAGILREIFGISSKEIINYFTYNNSFQCKKIDDQFDHFRRQKAYMTLSQLLFYVIENINLFERIQCLSLYSDFEWMHEKNRVLELCYFAESQNMTLWDAEELFVAHLSMPANDGLVDDNAIQMMTYHKSKGLEWPIVILPFLSRGRQLKSGMKCDENGRLYDVIYNNECRLLYVACTRAKQRLILYDDSDVFDKNLRAGMVSSLQILSSFK